MGVTPRCLGRKVKRLRRDDGTNTGRLTGRYDIQPTALAVGKDPVSGRLMFGVTRGAMALPCLLRPSANPIELGVVFDPMFDREASK